MHSEPSMTTFAATHQQTLLTIAANARPIAGIAANRPARPSRDVAIRRILGSALIALGTRLHVQADMSVSAGSMANLRGAH